MPNYTAQNRSSAMAVSPHTNPVSSRPPKRQKTATASRRHFPPSLSAIQPFPPSFLAIPPFGALKNMAEMAEISPFQQNRLFGHWIVNVKGFAALISDRELSRNHKTWPFLVNFCPKQRKTPWFSWKWQKPLYALQNRIPLFHGANPGLPRKKTFIFFLIKP